jgi:hypothetical protein
VTIWKSSDELPAKSNGRTNMKKFHFFLLSAVLVFGFSATALAQHGHGHGESTPPAKTGAGKDSGAKGKQDVQSKSVEGLKISLQVMSMSEHMQHAQKGSAHGDADHSKTHTLMVTLQDEFSKEILADAKIRYTVVAPSGQKETGQLTWFGDSYSAGFSPKEKGPYQIQLKVESGGAERDTNFTYRAA